MLTDVEIAQSAEMKPIVEIAQKVGLDEDDLELYGKYKAKISLEAIKKLDQNEDGKLILEQQLIQHLQVKGKQQQ